MMAAPTVSGQRIKAKDAPSRRTQITKQRTRKSEPILRSLTVGATTLGASPIERQCRSWLSARQAPPLMALANAVTISAMFDIDRYHSAAAGGAEVRSAVPPFGSMAPVAFVLSLSPETRAAKPPATKTRSIPNTDQRPAVALATK